MINSMRSICPSPQIANLPKHSRAAAIFVFFGVGGSQAEPELSTLGRIHLSALRSVHFSALGRKHLSETGSITLDNEV